MDNAARTSQPESTAPWRQWLLRVSLAVGGTLAACGVATYLTSTQRVSLAGRLAERALESSGAACQSTVRELARLGPAAIEPMVRLAASQREEVARTAQRRVLDWLAAWELEYAERKDTELLAERLALLAKSLEERAAEFGGEGRRWADQVASEMVRSCKPLSAPDAWSVLAACDRVLTVSYSSPPSIVVTAPLELPAAPPPPPGGELLAAPPSALRPAAPSEPPALDLAPAEVPPLRASVAVIAPAAPPAPPPVTEARPSSPADNSLRKPSSARIVDDSSRPATDHAGRNPGSEVIDVPSPQDLRNSMRLLRELPDRELLDRLNAGARFEDAAARRVLEQRGYTRGVLNAIERMKALPAAERRSALEQFASLPGAEARRLLRWFVSDADPEVRLQALSMLATTCDPQLERIARERAVEDGDPRVAELATELMKAR